MILAIPILRVSRLTAELPFGFATLGVRVMRIVVTLGGNASAWRAHVTAEAQRTSVQIAAASFAAIQPRNELVIPTAIVRRAAPTSPTKPIRWTCSARRRRE